MFQSLTDSYLTLNQSRKRFRLILNKLIEDNIYSPVCTHNPPQLSSALDSFHTNVSSRTCVCTCELYVWGMWYGETKHTPQLRHTGCTFLRFHLLSSS